MCGTEIWFSKIFISIIYMKMKSYLILKKCRRFSKTASQKIDFTAYGLYTDYPTAWELNQPSDAPGAQFSPPPSPNIS